jgi:hypothetical protein
MAYSKIKDILAMQCQQLGDDASKLDVLPTVLPRSREKLFPNDITLIFLRKSSEKLCLEIRLFLPSDCKSYRKKFDFPASQFMCSSL